MSSKEYYGFEAKPAVPILQNRNKFFYKNTCIYVATMKWADRKEEGWRNEFKRWFRKEYGNKLVYFV